MELIQSKDIHVDFLRYNSSQVTEINIYIYIYMIFFLAVFSL